MRRNMVSVKGGGAVVKWDGVVDMEGDGVGPGRESFLSPEASLEVSTSGTTPPCIPEQTTGLACSGQWKASLGPEESSRTAFLVH